MSEINRFSFENKDLDFPIYKKNPHVPIWGWIVMFISMIIAYILMLSSLIPLAIVSMLIPLITVLYFLKWNINAIFQKPKAKDIGLAVALFVGYMIYSWAVGGFFESLGFVSAAGNNSPVTIMTIPPVFFTTMSEELVKFIPFMFFLRVAFKYSDNRKMSVIVSMFLVIILFASMHAFNLNTFIFAFVVQGLGSIFEFIGYIKTKNLLIPYITHLCTDVFIYSLALMGMA